MNRIQSAIIVASTVLLTGWSSAQTGSSREFARLKEQRDKAVASAIAPIDQKYHEMLKSLLTRATQEGDYKTVTAITEVLSADKTSTAPGKPSNPKAMAPVSAGIWAPTNADDFYYVLVTNADGTVNGILYIGVPNKSAQITGKKNGNLIEAHWPSVYQNQLYDGTFTDRSDGGLDLDRVNADGAQKGRKDNFQLKRLTGEDYKRARKLIESRVTTTEDERTMRRLPRD